MKLRCRRIERAIREQTATLQQAASESKDRFGIRRGLQLLDRMLIVAVVVCLGLTISVFIPWSVLQLVFKVKSNLQPALDQASPLDHALSRMNCLYMAIMLSATLPFARANLRPLLLQLPISDAAIRRRESPLRSWPWLFAYSILVFGLFEWQHGPKTWTSATVVSLLALGQTMATLSFAGIVKLLRRQECAPIMPAIICMMTGALLFLPPEEMADYLPGKAFLSVLPTAWAVVMWRDGWIEGRFGPWLYGVPIVAMWAIERWLVEQMPIPVEARKDSWLRRTWQSVGSGIRPERTKQPSESRNVLDEVRLALDSLSRDASSARSRWLTWPLTRRDEMIVDFYQFRGDRPVPTWFIVAAWCFVVSWGRLATFLSGHTLYIAAFDSIGVLFAMMTTAWVVRSSQRLETPSHLGAFPIGYDESLHAAVRLAIAFAKRFLPGQILLIIVLIAFDRLAPHAALTVAMSPLLAWNAYVPIMCVTILYDQRPALFSGVVILPLMLAAVGAAACLNSADKASSLVGLIASIGGLWVIHRVSRWIYHRGIGEDLVSMSDRDAHRLD